jgi:ssDNA-binding Zn-finger/Zn-ribbon topoisomerase 1
MNEWNGKSIVLEIDHIDGNSENNSPENLRFICPNCHSQLLSYILNLFYSRFVENINNPTEYSA